MWFHRAAPAALFVAFGSIAQAAQKHSHSSCQDASVLLTAAIGDVSHPDDLLSPDPPELPQVPVEKPAAIYLGNHTQAGELELRPLTADSDFWRIGWMGVPPPAQLVKNWHASPLRSISACYFKRSAVRPLRSFSGLNAHGPEPQNGFLSPAIISATEPVFDANRSRAIILFSTAQIRGLGGRIELVFLERRALRWRKAGYRVLSVS
jgi:hypothetical protein